MTEQDTFLVTVFLSGGIKSVLRTSKEENLHEVMRKACKISSIPAVLKGFEKCVARRPDGTILNSSSVGDNVVIVFLPKENFEASVINDLRSVVTRDDVERLKELLQIPCYLVSNCPGKDSPLHCAIRHGLLDAAKELLKCPVTDVNLQLESTKSTPLHKAASAGNVELTVLLIFCGAFLNIKNKQGLTPKQEAKNTEVTRIFEQVEQANSVDVLRAQYTFLESLVPYKPHVHPLVQFAQDFSHISMIETELNHQMTYKMMMNTYVLIFRISGEVTLVLVPENAPLVSSPISYLLSRECPKIGLDVSDCRVTDSEKNLLQQSQPIKSFAEKEIYIWADKKKNSTPLPSARDSKRGKRLTQRHRDKIRERDKLRREEIISYFRTTSLSEHLKDSHGWECFHNYLHSLYSGEITLYWQAVDQMQGLTDEEEIKQKCEQIFEQFLLPDAPYQLSIMHTKIRDLKLRRSKPTADMFDASQKIVISTCSSHWMTYPNTTYFNTWVEEKLAEVSVSEKKNNHGRSQSSPPSPLNVLALSDPALGRKFRSTDSEALTRKVRNMDSESTASMETTSISAGMEPIFRSYFGLISGVMAGTAKENLEISLQTMRLQIETKFKGIMEKFFPNFKQFSVYLTQAFEREGKDFPLDGHKAWSLVENSPQFAAVCLQKTIVTELKTFQARLSWLAMCIVQLEKEERISDDAPYILLLGHLFNILRSMDNLALLVIFFQELLSDKKFPPIQRKPRGRSTGDAKLDVRNTESEGKITQSQSPLGRKSEKALRRKSSERHVTRLAVSRGFKSATHSDKLPMKRANTRPHLEFRNPSQDIAESNNERSNMERSNTERSNTERSNTEQSNTERSNTERSSTERPSTERWRIERPSTERSKIERSSTERSNVERSNTERSLVERSNTERSLVERSNTERSFQLDMEQLTFKEHVTASRELADILFISKGHKQKSQKSKSMPPVPVELAEILYLADPTVSKVDISPRNRSESFNSVREAIPANRLLRNFDHYANSTASCPVSATSSLLSFSSCPSDGHTNPENCDENSQESPRNSEKEKHISSSSSAERTPEGYRNVRTVRNPAPIDSVLQRSLTAPGAFQWNEAGGRAFVELGQVQEKVKELKEKVKDLEVDINQAMNQLSTCVSVSPRISPSATPPKSPSKLASKSPHAPKSERSAHHSTHGNPSHNPRNSQGRAHRRRSKSPGQSHSSVRSPTPKKFCMSSGEDIPSSPCSIMSHPSVPFIPHTTHTLHTPKSNASSSSPNSASTSPRPKVPTLLSSPDPVASGPSSACPSPRPKTPSLLSTANSNSNSASPSPRPPTPLDQNPPTPVTNNNGVTLEGLIQLATSDIASDLMGASQLVFSEASPESIWAGLQEFYADNVDNAILRARCVKLISNWVKSRTCFGGSMLSKELIESVLYFANNKLNKDGYSAFVEGLVENLQPARSQDWAKFQTPKISTFPTCSVSSDFILRYSVDAVAKQLLRIDYKLFKRVNCWEMQFLAKADPSLNTFTSNASKLTKRCDKLSFWTATLILDSKQRQKMYSFLVKLAHHLLFTIHNYSSGLGITNGLTASHIERFHLQEQLSKKNKERLEAIKKLQSPLRNFAELREAIERVGDTAVPFPGIYVKDLAMIEEVYATYLSRDPDTYDLHKFQLMYQIISKFLGKWKIANQIPDKIEPLYTFLTILPHHTENSIFWLSKEILSRER
eukprot:TRINITY_DN1685_c0_g1_i1.p1 TRINITY_DN1685_c0_g1~~TRINITY_DN1685_c0_g1_i1.p1  ORF type:complete len:1707 (+),score=243.54 TRINITY_DN1685_c0_g1_i1:93-5213(+)